MREFVDILRGVGVVDGGHSSETELREMGLVEFVSHLEEAFQPEQRRRVTFFLGAGASRSSNIPTASELVKDHWLPLAMRRARDTSGMSLEDWARERYGYDPENPAALYGRLIDEVFPMPLHRQCEIERLVGMGRPGVGYGLLARFMAHPQYSQTVQTVLTTNFDDMVADALQIHVRKRARVIGHHSLAAFIQTHHATPQIVKLHGDAHLEPLNTEEETRSLAKALLARVAALLSETMLVFVGYGGSDRSVVELLETLGQPPNAGVWWVNDKPPAMPEFRKWLGKSRGIWVKHLDFDELMVLVAERFKDMVPEMEDHFQEDRENFKKSYEGLVGRLRATPADAPGALEKRGAMDEITSRLKTPWGLATRAWTLRHDAQSQAEVLFEKAISAAPNDAAILELYGIFLEYVQRDLDRAEAVYKRALIADPEHVAVLSRYAHFMAGRRKEFAAAEALYERALAVDPLNVAVLGNLASHYRAFRRDFIRAEELYERALALDPLHAANLTNYANFKEAVRQDMDGAEALYERALAADPDHANNLANYGGFLLVCGRAGEGWKMLQAARRTLDLQTDRDLLLELKFYQFVHGDQGERLAALRSMRALIGENVRSFGFDLSAHCASARDRGHPDAEMIAVLADVIEDKRPADDLLAFPSWTAAGS